MATPDDNDSQIDDLYRGPLTEFTAARNAIVKTLRGADASRVRKLAKPSVVAWAVNQVYWRARRIYDQLIKSGERLRKAQITALEGKSADVRTASDAHRRAIADAVKEAQRLAGAAGSQPSPDALMRTFEALSLAAEPPEPPGRLTKELQPAGFEALSGVTPKPVGPAKAGRHQSEAGPADRPRQGNGGQETGRHQAEPSALTSKDNERAARERARIAAAVAKRHAAEEKKRAIEIKKAEAVLERARAAEGLARAAAERAREAVVEAEARLKRMKAQSS